MCGPNIPGVLSAWNSRQSHIDLMNIALLVASLARIASAIFKSCFWHILKQRWNEEDETFIGKTIELPLLWNLIYALTQVKRINAKRNIKIENLNIYPCRSFEWLVHIIQFVIFQVFWQRLEKPSMRVALSGREQGTQWW